MEIVSALRLAVTNKMGEERFALWVGDSARFTLEEDRLTLHVPHQFQLDFLRRKFRREIETACEETLSRPITLEFRLDVSLASAAATPKTAATHGGNRAAAEESFPAVLPMPAPAPSREAAAGAATKTASRRFARFEDFVVGECNRVAYTSAQMVVDSPGRHTPLYFYGPAGVGKTLLLEGVWSAARVRDRSARMVYLSAEQFTTYFLEALNGKGLPTFRRKYRDLALLILDDVQFFAGKRATLMEVTHTVDTLLRAGRQVVLAGNRPPAEMTELGPELVTRLSSGLTCRLEPPDAATRQGILRQLMQRMAVPLDESVQQWVARHITGDARLLAGALHRLRATSIAEERPISVEMAETALGDLVQAGRSALRLVDIERAVCETFGLTGESLRSAGRAHDVRHPRMLAMWLARRYTRAALSEISQFFGRRSHSTVVTAEKKIECWLDRGEAIQLAGRRCNLRETVRRIESHLRVG